MDLGKVGQFIAQLVNRKKHPQTGVPVRDETPDPGFVPRPDSAIPVGQDSVPIGGFKPRHNPKIEEYTKIWEDAQKQLRQGAPAESKPTLPENIAGALFGSILSNPTASAKAYGAPAAIAQQRTATNLAGYEAQQKAAQQSMTGAGQMIGHLQDADQAADAVESKIRLADMQGQIKMAIANAKNDITLVKSLANLEATGGVTENSAAMILQQLHPEWEWDAAQEAGKQLYQKYLTDPSLKMALEKDKVAIQGQKAQADETLKYTKIAEDDTNVNAQGRLRAMLKLKQIDPNGSYGQMTIQEMQQAAEALSPKGQLTVDQQELTKANTKWRKVYTDLLPKDLAIKAAAFSFSVEKFQKEFELASQKFDQDGMNEAYKREQDAKKGLISVIETEYKGVTDQLKNLRDKQAEFSKMRAAFGTSGQITDKDGNVWTSGQIDKEIKEYGAEIKKLKDRAAALEERIHKVSAGDMEEDEKPLNSQNTPWQIDPAFQKKIGLAQGKRDPRGKTPKLKVPSGYGLK